MPPKRSQRRNGGDEEPTDANGDGSGQSSKQAGRADGVQDRARGKPGQSSKQAARADGVQDRARGKPGQSSKQTRRADGVQDGDRGGRMPGIVGNDDAAGPGDAPSVEAAVRKGKEPLEVTQSCAGQGHASAADRNVPNNTSNRKAQIGRRIEDIPKAYSSKKKAGTSSSRRHETKSGRQQQLASKDEEDMEEEAETSMSLLKKVKKQIKKSRNDIRIKDVQPVAAQAKASSEDIEEDAVVSRTKLKKLKRLNKGMNVLRIEEAPKDSSSEKKAGSCSSRTLGNKPWSQQQLAESAEANKDNIDGYLEQDDDTEANKTKPKKLKVSKVVKKQALRQRRDEVEDCLLLHRCISDVHLKEQNQSSKKTQKKAPPQGGGDTTSDGPAVDTKDPATIAMNIFEEYESHVLQFTYDTKRQPVVNDSPVFDMIHITSIPTPDDLIQYTEESLNLYLKVRSFSITVEVDGVPMVVPVTKATPANFEDSTYHVVVMTRPSDEAQVHFLIEQFNNYLRAFKIVLRKENPDGKFWLILGLKNKLPSFFKKCKNILIKESYSFVERVVLHCETYSEIFNLFLSYDVESPEKIFATDREKVLFDTAYVVLCEILRFRVVKRFTLKGVTRDRHNPLKIPVGFSTLLRDWSYLSKLIFLLYLALLEKPMLDKQDDQSSNESSDFSTMSDAAALWKLRQENLGDITFYYEAEETQMKLEWLCGRHLTLLRHDMESCHKVLMRDLGYAGGWLVEFRHPSDVKRATVNERASVMDTCGVDVFQGDDYCNQDEENKDADVSEEDDFWTELAKGDYWCQDEENEEVSDEELGLGNV